MQCENGYRAHIIDRGAGTRGGVFCTGPARDASGHSNFKGNYPEWAEQGYRCLVIDMVGFGLLRQTR